MIHRRTIAVWCDFTLDAFVAFHPIGRLRLPFLCAASLLQYLQRCYGLAILDCPIRVQERFFGSLFFVSQNAAPMNPPTPMIPATTTNRIQKSPASFNSARTCSTMCCWRDVRRVSSVLCVLYTGSRLKCGTSWSQPDDCPVYPIPPCLGPSCACAESCCCDDPEGDSAVLALALVFLCV